MIENLFFILFAGIGISYTWGMRGTIIGGEKGAMLPGALLGLLMSFFSGSVFFAESPWILAGVGAMAMYCGGNMTYGETLGLSMNTKPAENMKKGLTALFVKGGIWFGLFGGYTSLFISSVAGRMELLHIILFFALLPVFALAFYYLLNKPHDKEKGRFPKIYFSKTRKETWGGLFGLLVEIIVFAIIIRDYATLVMTAGTFISGAVGWVVAQILQIRTIHTNKKGKRLFSRAYENGLVDSWKIMECVLGAIGGAGTAVTFIFTRNLYANTFAIIDILPRQSFRSEAVGYIILAVYAVILLADTMQYFIVPANSDSIHYRRYTMLVEKSEFAVYSIFPLLLCFLGFYSIAAVVAFPVVMLVLCQETAEKCLTDNKKRLLWKLIFFIPEFILILIIAVNSKAIDTGLTIVMYTFFYEAVFFIIRLFKTGKITVSNDEKTVHGYFIICCLVINILTIIYRSC